MKILFLFLQISFLSVFVFGQKIGPSAVGKTPISNEKQATLKPCQVLLENLPLFHGVRVGMKYEEIAEIYPEIKGNQHFQNTYSVDKSGLFMMESSKISNPAFIKDTQQISLNIQDDELTVISIDYTSTKWNSDIEMKYDLSQLLSLEIENWKIHNGASIEANCLDFDVYANHLASSPPIINSTSIHKLKKKEQ